MSATSWLAGSFEAERPRLRAVAYRMLGSISEAEDAVQEAWLRVSRADADAVENPGAWLTTIVARVCLNMLRSRRVRREESLGVHLPDPIISLDPEVQPEEQAVLADSVGLALLVVLDSMTPAERLAFVLHDVFELPFEEIAPMVERTPAATRQLASRARRRVKGAELTSPEPDRTRQRAVVDAFFAAARGGDLEQLLRVLDPEVVLRADFGSRHPRLSVVTRGAAEVAQSARLGAAIPGTSLVPVWVNGVAGALVILAGRPISLMAFVVAEDRIVEIDGIAAPARLRRLTAPVLRELASQGLSFNR